MSVILSKELLRKSIHLAGMLILVIYYFTDRFTVLFWLVPLVFVTLQLEWMRLSGSFRYPAVLLRPSEEHRVAGYVYSITAACIVIALFPKTIAITALTMAVLGDFSSGIAGAMWGKKADVRQMRLPIKPVPILLVMLLVCFFTGYLAAHAPGLAPLPVYSVALGALGATLADGVPWQIRGRVLDDNLTIPLVSALLMLVSTGF
jgi:dolichol kinase